jgi:hypothetical protein
MERTLTKVGVREGRTDVLRAVKIWSSHVLEAFFDEGRRQRARQ